jgi:hypothetical protein
MSDTMTIVLSRSVERALQEACVSFGKSVMTMMVEKYNLDLEEVRRELSLESLCVTRGGGKRGGGVAKTKKEKTTKETKPKKTKLSKPSCVLPYCGSVMEERCYGLKQNHGLMSQCWNEKMTEDVYCRVCRKQADKNDTGKPDVGDVRDRLDVGILEYRNPKGKQCVPYANVMEKLGITLEMAQEEASKFGLTIPAEQLEKRVSKRGRPACEKKSVVSSSGGGDRKEEEKPKKRGRKPKGGVVVSAAVEDDLIAALKKAEADAEVVEKAEADADAEVEKPVEKKTAVEKTAVEKTAVVETEKTVEKTVEKKTAVEKPVEVEEKELEAELENSGIDSGVDEESSGGSDSEEEEEEAVTVRKFEYGGTTYLRSSTNVMYDITSHERVGMWNEELKKIEEIDEEDSSDEEEDDE